MTGSEHPLSVIANLAKQDRHGPLEHVVEDHASWGGRWPTPSRTELTDWETHGRYGLTWPCSRPEVYAVQTALKEHKWKDMKPDSEKQLRQDGKRV